MRLVFMGMGGPLSSVPLQQLLQAGYAFQAVIIAAARPGIAWRQLPRPAGTGKALPLAASAPSDPGIVQLAWKHDIPLFETSDLGAGQALEAFGRLAPHAVLVSCFAYRVPPRLLRLPQHGFLNLHPSLLPAYRGPFPLFWQLRDGLRELGVTVHRMDEALDEGPIALQTTVRLEDGLSGTEIDRRLGQAGGRLFSSALQALASDALIFNPQEGPRSYQGRPQDEDFALDRRWPARRAFNFMRGTAEWARPYLLDIGDRRLRLRRALAYDPGGAQPQAVIQSPDSLSIQFRPGILRAI